MPNEAVVTNLEDTPAIEDYPESEVVVIEEGDREIVEIVDSTEAFEWWPIYLSLGTIAVTFLLIIIINIAGHKKQK